MGMESQVLIIVLLVICCLVPCCSSQIQQHRKTLRKPTSYAVIFDAGSTGSRVHVFHFNQTLDLIPIGKDLEFLEKVTPGLSAYAKNPEKAAESLIPLLDEAESVVPKRKRHKTPLRLGATAGLRFLEGNASELILQAVRDTFKERSTLKLESDDAVAVIDGTQEGSYLWVAINYLLSNLAKEYSETVGVVDLGGGSVQMAYAVSEENAANAPNAQQGDDPYITQMYLKGTKYFVYVHSYLSYGKEAARAEILKVTRDSGNPCILAGFNGSYVYRDVEYKASAMPGGSSFNECRDTVLKALNVKATCTHKNCTFGGIWNGGGGPGQKNLYLATSFYYVATETGIADINKPSDKIRIVDYKIAAQLACNTTLEEAKSTFPLFRQKALQYVCLDLVYQYTLLVDGFGLDPWQEVTVVNQVKYKDYLVEAAWPLGTAIEATGIADINKPSDKIRIADYKIAAQLACNTTLEEAKSTFPLFRQKDLQYVCLDLVYQYTLLVDGFGLDPWQEVTVVNQVKYKDYLVEAAWPLGTAIEAVSSLPTFDRLFYFL